MRALGRVVVIGALLAAALVLASGRLSPQAERVPPTSWQGTNEALCRQARTDAGERPAACADLRSTTPAASRPAGPSRSHASMLAA